jgi:hypothetical protein
LTGADLIKFDPFATDEGTLALLAVADKELLAGAGEADVAEAAFFSHPRIRALQYGLAMRKQAILGSDHENYVEFQAFAGVETHEANSIVGTVIIAGGYQGDVPQVVCDCCVGFILAPEGDRVDQLFDVAFSFRDFFRGFLFVGFQMLVVVGAAEDFGQEVGNSFATLIQSVDEV